MSKFRISITRADGEPVYLRPGGRGERDLVDAVLARLIAHGVCFFRPEIVLQTMLNGGVGFLRTESQVKEAFNASVIANTSYDETATRVREAFTDVLHDLKSEVVPG